MRAFYPPLDWLRSPKPLAGRIPTMTTTRTSAPAVAPKGLAGDQIGIVGSTALAISSTAPVFTLAATLGLIVAAVGVATPIYLILSVIPALFIAFGYRALNQVDPDAGTTFTWATRAIGPRTGWFGGWAIIVSSVVFCANAADIVGVYSMRLISGEAEPASVPCVAIGLGFIIAMTALAYAGVRFTARTQLVLVAAQILVLGVLVAVALSRVASGESSESAEPASWEWLNPAGGVELTSATQALLLGVFLYWGWDTAMSVNEETHAPAKTPGSSILIATAALVGCYTMVAVALQAFAGTAALGGEDAGEDVFAAVAEPLLGSTGVTVLSIMVIVSAAAALATTILPSSRTVFAMATYRAAPRIFGRTNSHGTPSVATIGIGVAGCAFYVGMAAISDNMLADSILSISMAICVYYAITGLTSAVWFARSARGASALLSSVLLPGIGGLLMLLVLMRSAWDMADPEYGDTSLLGVGGALLIGAGSLLAGLVFMAIWARAEPSFFRTHDRVDA